MKTFPKTLFDEDLIQQGYGQCETFAENHVIELHLKNGVLILLPNGTWRWNEDGFIYLNGEKYDKSNLSESETE